MSETVTAIPLAERLASTLPGAQHAVTADGFENLIVPRSLWLAAARAVNELGYIRFIDLTAVDEPNLELRFDIHLLVYSMTEARWLRLRTRTDHAVSSVVSVYAGADMYEREVYDLFGVDFEGHPKLTRIMLPEGWQGHPLRRDEIPVLEPVDFTVTRDLYNT